MENRPLSVAAFLIAAGLAGWVQAADAGPTPAQQADWRARQAEASRLQAEADRIEKAAKAVYDEREKACYREFQVNACRQEARRAYNKELNASRRLQSEGKTLDNAVRKEQRQDADQRYAAGAPERAADRTRREAETTTLRQQAEAQIAAKRADKEKAAQAGQQKREQEAARLREKQAKHAAKVARKMEKARQKDVDRARSVP